MFISHIDVTESGASTGIWREGFCVSRKHLTSSGDKKPCLFTTVQKSCKTRSESGLILNLKKQP